jgi:hypothetical protein
MSGKIVKLLLAKDIDSSMQNVNQMVLEEKKGIFGDRYYYQKGTFSNEGKIEPDRDVTLIEIENIDTFNKEYEEKLSAEDLRRNIVVSNCDLNSLVDKQFQIGNIVLKGIRLCEPCNFLAKKLDSKKFLKGMLHKSGLRAQIIKGGSIDLDSQVEIL